MDKCEVLHIGSNNERVNYSVIGSQLVKVNEEKDSGDTITTDLKSSKHCSEVVKAADKLVVFIGRSFECKLERGNSHVI